MSSTILKRYPPIYNLSSQIQNSYKTGLKRISVPYSKTNKDISFVLLNEGLVQNVCSGDVHGPFLLGKKVELNKNNISQARLWIDLKYRNGQPALTTMRCISKPSRRIFASPDECRAIASARATATSSGLLKSQVLGQVTILNTPYGIIEMKDALLKGVGGEVLCFAA